MITLPYSQLNRSQLGQVAHLFADDAFGTDAAAFLYELGSKGEICGRSRVDQVRRPVSTRKVSTSRVITREEVHLTYEMIKQSQTNMDALAAIVARDLYTRSTMEVQQEISS